MTAIVRSFSPKPLIYKEQIPKIFSENIISFCQAVKQHELEK